MRRFPVSLPLVARKRPAPCRVALTALLLTGCSGSEPPETTDSASPGGGYDPVPIGLCLSPEAGWPQESGADGEPLVAAVEGVLTEVADGLPADGPCSDQDYRGWVGDSSGAAPQHGVVTAASGDRWLVATALPGVVLSDLEGAVAVDFSLAFGGFSPTVGHGILSASGVWAVWIADAGEPAQLVVPAGVSIARGAELEAERAECGSWHDFATEVTVDGSTATLNVGESAQVGSATITVGADEQQDPNQVECLDWFVARVLVGGAKA